MSSASFEPSRFVREWEEGLPADEIARGHGLGLKDVYNMRVSLGLGPREPVPFDDPAWVDDQKEAGLA